jgi:hypothetical protein
MQPGIGRCVFHRFAQGLRCTGRILQLRGANVSDAFPQMRLGRTGCERLLIDFHCVSPLALHLGAQAGVRNGLCRCRQRCIRAKSQCDYQT